MMPVGLLMKEHKLIERMVALMRKRLDSMQAGARIDADFLERMVEFFKDYTDRCHHGKEEDILFRALAEKDLTPALRATMNELAQQHVRARELVGKLLLDKTRHQRGDATAAKDIVKALAALTDMYPRHIEMENQHFFIPVMDYLNDAERTRMLNDFAEFDRALIHKKYQSVVEELERENG